MLEHLVPCAPGDEPTVGLTHNPPDGRRYSLRRGRPEGILRAANMAEAKSSHQSAIEANENRANFIAEFANTNDAARFAFDDLAYTVKDVRTPAPRLPRLA